MKRLILHISALFALTSCVQQNRMPDVHILHDTIRDTVYLPMPDSDAKGTDAKAEETQSVVVKEGETSYFDGLTCKEYAAVFNIYNEDTNTEFRRELRIVYPIEYGNMFVLSKIQKKVLDATGLDSENSDIKNNITNLIDSDFNDWKEGESPLTEDGPDLSNTLYMQGSIDFFNRKILCYETYMETYTGGAHGHYSYNYIVFDMTDGSVISASDIFNEGYKNGLSKILRNRAKTTNNWSEEDLISNLNSPDEIEASDIFGISNDSITFVYNPYAIGPYSTGIVKISVPFDEIKEFLKDDKVHILPIE
ncbi:MAG: RsiV family protein [Paludibacteraceae bacterium]|nr:RsiV family protein [Paludibacteraceae bacterium]